MPKRGQSARFPDPFDKKKQDAVYMTIIDCITAEGTMYPSVLRACTQARNLLRRPDITLFKQLMETDLRSVDQNEFYLKTQLLALFKKRADLDLGIDKADVAFRTFLKSEGLCRAVNRKLSKRDDPDSQERAALVFKMQRKISRVLGNLPDFADIPFGFGPGTNVGCSKNTSVRHKLNSDVTATEAALRYFVTRADTFHAYSFFGLKMPRIVSGSRWTSVPKTSLTDRGINVEPILNAYLQKGYGSLIRDALRHVGINLNDQTHNQRLAREGSISGKLSTIDLSMASDLISYLLVMELLPWEWFEALDAVRSPVCELPDGSFVILEKFSSMGNGATFELESLIFWALLSVVCGDDATISVYGDDLICPSECFDEVLHALTLLGFVPNDDKSFKDGPFRESCGKDYWEGTDVRPVFIKNELSLKEIFRLHNFFVRTGRLGSLPQKLLSFIAKRDRIYGPDGFGDGHLLWETAPRPVRDKRGWEPFHVITTWQAKPRVVRTPLSSDYSAFLYLRADSGLTLSSHELREQMEAESIMFNERSSNPRYHKKRIRVPAAL